MDLYPYQEEGSAFLATRRKALLADTMGLGKTAQAIVACDRVGAARVLVICPAGVRINWRREFGRFSETPRPLAIVQTGKDAVAEYGITVISYELATSPTMHKRLMKMTFDVLILDECHFLKNRSAKRTEAVFGPRCHGDAGLISRAKHTWALTGTPTPNHPGEIFSTLRAFGVWTQNYYAFEARFCETQQGDFGTIITGMKNVPELKALVKPIMLRRKLEEVMTDLPKLTVDDIVLPSHGVTHPEELTAWQEAEKGREARALRSLIENAADENDIDLNSVVHTATLRRLTGLAKVRPVAELITRELETGLEKIVVFGEHRDVLEMLRQQLTHYGAQVIYGGNSPETKQQRLDRFCNMWKYRVLIGHIRTLGTGIDGLQAVCNNGLFIESSWTPSDNYQAIGRLRRTGQSRPVFFRFASLAGSLDEHIQRIIRRKTQMIAQLLD